MLWDTASSQTGMGGVPTMLHGFQRKSLALASFLAASLVAGCQGSSASLRPEPSASFGPEVTACQSAGDTANAEPTLTPVVGIDHGIDGVLVLTAPVPGDETTFYLGLCRYERRPVVLTTDNAGGTLARTFGGGVSLDRHIDVDGPPAQGALAGRIVDGAAAVQVTLESGASVDAVVRDGYWIAWWPGSARASTVRALDANGNEVGTITAPQS